MSNQRLHTGRRLDVRIFLPRYPSESHFELGTDRLSQSSLYHTVSFVAGKSNANANRYRITWYGFIPDVVGTRARAHARTTLLLTHERVKTKTLFDELTFYRTNNHHRKLSSHLSRQQNIDDASAGHQTA